MKVVRLPSGPLACVYSLAADDRAQRVPSPSGIFRAHSGSLHADGNSEDEALAVLDQQVRRISQHPEDDADPTRDSLPGELEMFDSWGAGVRKCTPSADVVSSRSSRPSSPDDATPSEGVGILRAYAEALKKG